MACPSVCPGARWFSTAAVEGDRGGACQSRGGSDASAAGAGSLGRGPAREPDGRDPGREDRSLPVCQEYHGSTSHQRPPGAQVDISLLSRSSSYSKLCSDFMFVCFLIQTLHSLYQNLGNRPAKGSMCTGVYICGPWRRSCCRRSGQCLHVALLHRALRRQQVQTHTYFQDRLQVSGCLTGVKTNNNNNNNKP